MEVFLGRIQVFKKVSTEEDVVEQIKGGGMIMRTLINVILLYNAIALTAIGLCERDLIIACIGGVCAGLYNFIIEKDIYESKNKEDR